ncbi:MAG: IPT/TIG domain-containing protein [Anaerolineae bacterium]|nr:IPT/TIG domain-containing protein [Anaerolineae bacterium]
MPDYEEGLPIEEFIQALSSQLDRAQAALAVKARFGLPLTFAVKDISIDLRAHVSLKESQVLVTPTGPNDPGGSIIHLSLTSITRPMIQENTLDIEPNEPPLQEVLGEEISDEERRRLEWAGIRTVSQLRELERQSGENVVEQVAQIPAMRLRAALIRASQPRINQVQRSGEQLRIAGRNLRRDGQQPQVRIGGNLVRILSADEREIVVEPPQILSGTLAIETGPGLLVETDLDESAVSNGRPSQVQEPEV